MTMVSIGTLTRHTAIQVFILRGIHHRGVGTPDVVGVSHLVGATLRGTGI